MGLRIDVGGHGWRPVACHESLGPAACRLLRGIHGGPARKRRAVQPCSLESWASHSCCPYAARRCTKRRIQMERAGFNGMEIEPS